MSVTVVRSGRVLHVHYCIVDTPCKMLLREPLESYPLHATVQLTNYNHRIKWCMPSPRAVLLASFARREPLSHARRVREADGFRGGTMRRGSRKGGVFATKSLEPAAPACAPSPAPAPLPARRGGTRVRAAAPSVARAFQRTVTVSHEALHGRRECSARSLACAARARGACVRCVAEARRVASV